MENPLHNLFHGNADLIAIAALLLLLGAGSQLRIEPTSQRNLVSPSGVQRGKPVPRLLPAVTYHL